VSVRNAPLSAPKRSLSFTVGVVSQPLEVTQGKLRIVSSLYAAYHAARNLQLRALLPGNPEVEGGICMRLWLARCMFFYLKRSAEGIDCVGRFLGIYRHFRVS